MKEYVTILREALAYNPRAVFVGFSGGDDSLAVTHLMMNTITGGAQVLHINTGIGIEQTREFVRETCKKYAWPLLEVRAKEDCGQDYDELVMRWGFPGPAWHRLMYARLKDRCIEHVVRNSKKHRRDKIMLVMGIRKDESQRRMRYTGREINFRGAQMWVNPLYHYDKAWFMHYIRQHALQRNPVAETLGMSGECLCGAFAHKGEKALVRIVCPSTADRIDRLETQVRAAGFDWGWEDRPPRKKKVENVKIFMPLCVGCEK